MNRRSNVMSIAIPLVVLLIGAVVYQYGYLGVQGGLDREGGSGVRQVEDPHAVHDSDRRQADP